MIHPDDAALMYDGTIPAAVRAQLDSSAPRRFASAQTNAVRPKPKPAFIRARMVQVMATFAERGGITEQDLSRAGFTHAEIEEHKAEALRELLCARPGLLTLEIAA